MHGIVACVNAVAACVNASGCASTTFAAAGVGDLFMHALFACGLPDSGGRAAWVCRISQCISRVSQRISRLGARNAMVPPHSTSLRLAVGLGWGFR